MNVLRLPTIVWSIGDSANLLRCAHDVEGALFLPIWTSVDLVKPWSETPNGNKSIIKIDIIETIATLILANKPIEYVIVNLEYEKTDLEKLSIEDDIPSGQRIDISRPCDIGACIQYALKKINLGTRERTILEFAAERFQNLDTKALFEDGGAKVVELINSSPDDVKHDLAVALGEAGPEGAHAWQTLRPRSECDKCGERAWSFLGLSPNQIAASWQCRFCSRKVVVKERANEETYSANGRQNISKAVQREVWLRYEGRCAECGSREKLEYDHIIPVALGGATTARNLQLLCEPCNRRKGGRPPGG